MFPGLRLYITTMPDFLASWEIVRAALWPTIAPGGVEQAPVIAGGTLVYNPGLVMANMIPNPAGGPKRTDTSDYGTLEMANTSNAGALAAPVPIMAAAFTPAATSFMNSNPTQRPPKGDGVSPYYIARNPAGIALISSIGAAVAALGLLMVGPPPLPPVAAAIAPLAQVQWTSAGAAYVSKSMQLDATVIRFITSMFCGGT